MCAERAHAIAGSPRIDVVLVSLSSARARIDDPGETKACRGEAMTSDSFYARSTPQWLMVTSIVIGPIISGVIALAFILDPSWFTGLLLAICTVNLVMIIASWRNRARPLLEITDTEIRYASRD
jgi:hypothetical protein